MPNDLQFANVPGTGNPVIEPGALFDSRFSIEALGGAGGTGTVYRAFDTSTGQRVALKLLRETIPPGRDWIQRESRVLVHLDHPRIVRYVSHGVAGATPYVAVQWLEGETLAANLQRGPLGLGDLIAVGTGAAEGLAFAHEHGVVHRDVKPSNLFLVGGDPARVVLLDFGIAHVAAETLTRTGDLLGTPAYMSPEQARGGVFDARTDLFSLGCVLFECATRQRAFAGEHAFAILAKVLLEEPPSVQVLAPEVPEELAALIAQMLAKDPSARPRSAALVLEALRGLERRQVSTRTRTIAVTEVEQQLVSVVAVARPAANAPSARAALQKWVRTLVDSSRGRAEWLLDGSLVVVFAGYGSAKDQSILSARCALALRDDFPGQRIAIVTGQAVIAESTPLGEVIDRAAALLEEPDGTVRVDGITAALISQSFELRDEEGGATLVGERSDPGPRRTLLGRPTPHVGRNRELATLEALFAECVSERAARAVLVTAPGGYGKSRLREELLDSLQECSRPPVVWMARGDPIRAGSPFGLLAELVAQAAGWLASDPPALRWTKLRGRVAACAPAGEADRIAAFLGEMVGVAPRDAAPLLAAATFDHALMADQLRRSFEEWIFAESSIAPLVIVLEDLQWGDGSTVRFVDAALRVSCERPLLVLGFARPEIRELFPDLWVDRDVQEIRLGKLSHRSSEQLLRAALGEASPASVARIVETADGNPFYLEELIRDAATGGMRGPGSVLAMVTTRLETLPRGARRALRCASAFGEVFWRGGIASLTAQSTSEVDRLLRDVADRELILEHPRSRFSGDHEYGFRHAFIREAAYATLTDDDRALAHRLAARWLVERGERDPVFLAEQFERGGERIEAAGWYRRAAEAALRGHDLRSAVARVRSALLCGPSEQEQAAVRILEAEASNWLGDYIDAQRCATDALRFLPGAGPPRYSALTELAIASSVIGSRSTVIEIARELLEREPAEYDESYAIASLRVVEALLSIGELGLADRSLAALNRESAGIARTPLLQRLFAEVSARWSSFLGDLGASARFLRQSIAAAEAMGDKRTAAKEYGNLGSTLQMLGDYELAEAMCRETIKRGRDLGSEAVESAAKVNLCLVLGYLGRTDEALALGREAQAIFAKQRNSHHIAYTHLHLSTVLLLAGRAVEAEEEARLAIDHVGDNPQVLASALGTRAQALLACGEAREALSAAREANNLLQRLGGLEDREALVRLVFAQALRANGQIEESATAIAQARDCLLETAERIDDRRLRDEYLVRVPENACTLALADEWLGPAATATARCT